MAEYCQVCGKQITGILSNFGDHMGKIGFWISPDYGSNMRGMGGKCGRCGKLCCSDCFSGGMCPSCKNILGR